MVFCISQRNIEISKCSSVVRLRVPVGCTTELNHQGYQFIQQLFDKYDEVSSKFSCLSHELYSDMGSITLTLIQIPRGYVKSFLDLDAGRYLSTCAILSIMHKI